MTAEGSDDRKVKVNNANITVEDIRKERKERSNLFDQLD